MPKLRKLSDQLDKLITGFCALLLVTMLSVSFVGALYQAITDEALSWTYSLARQFVPWIGLLSITVAFKNGEHVAMAMLVNLAPARIRVVVEWIIVLAIGIFALTLLVFGFQYGVKSNQLVMISDQIQISQRWVAASLPTTGLVLLFHTVVGRALVEGPATTSDIAEGIVFDSDHITSVGDR